MLLPRPSYWILVAVTVAMVLGHICALPFHAHAGAITTHEESQSHHGERHSHHGGDSGDDDAVHAASCDALKSAPAGIDGAVLVPLGPVVTVASVPTRHVIETDAGVVAASPPLFLLHASLLI